MDKLNQSRLLDLSHITKNTYLKMMMQNQSRIESERGRAAPSHSFILAFADLDAYTQSMQQETTMYKDEEVSKLFNDKFNQSLIGELPKAPHERSFLQLNRSTN